MGNSQTRSTHHKNQKQSVHSEREGQTYTSQFSLSHFVGNLSGRSFVSVTSNQSVYSTSRPWSRVSRRRWNETTLSSPLEASKTAWPVANKESIFLPEFPIKTDLLQKDFEIKEVISKGAFGEVCKVRKISEGKYFALKVLSKSQIVSENAVRQVKDEARIQQACGHHAAIVGAVSRWQTKKRLYIVSEYIPGGELLALLRRCGRLPEDLVRLFIAELAIALDFLHNAGVIYRDLKPENILLDADCHLQLVDFGLSKWLPVGSRTTTLCGTLKYMAPEVLSREPYGHAVDWWSLGVVACRMLTDQYPTPAVGRLSNHDDSPDAETGQSSRKENHNDKYDYMSNAKPPGTLPEGSDDLSRGARALLLRLLERDPRVRLRSLRQLQQTAFYMGFNMENVKGRKVSPRSLLEQHFPNSIFTEAEDNSNQQVFTNFDQAMII